MNIKRLATKRERTAAYAARFQRHAKRKQETAAVTPEVTSPQPRRYTMTLETLRQAMRLPEKKKEA